jgi:hypothetical protein
MTHRTMTFLTTKHMRLLGMTYEGSGGETGKAGNKAVGLRAASTLIVYETAPC